MPVTEGYRHVTEDILLLGIWLSILEIGFLSSVFIWSCGRFKDVEQLNDVFNIQIIIWGL